MANAKNRIFGCDFFVSLNFKRPMTNDLTVSPLNGETLDGRGTNDPFTFSSKSTNIFPMKSRLYCIRSDTKTSEFIGISTANPASQRQSSV